MKTTKSFSTRRIFVFQLPNFFLYDRFESFSVEIFYVKSVVRETFDKELEDFSRYIFEKVFEGLVNDSMKFDVGKSECPFLPCLLTKTNEIDWKRMSTICQRSTRKLIDPSELDENELFLLRHVNPSQLIAADLNPSLIKFASDRWEFKRKDPTIETYADHFENKVPSIRIRRDFRLCTEKVVQKTRKFYLTPATSKENRQIEIEPKRVAHYPIELLEFAPLNQRDQTLISIFPSVFTRVVQLFHLTQLEKVFLDDENSAIFHRDEILSIDFTDGLTLALKNNVLPLSSFDYRLLFEKRRKFPSTLSFFFQSTTCRSAAEQTDLENLEILGDCFLKLSMSLSLYHQCPRGHSGELTQKKDRKISNKNLFNLANEKQLKRFLSAYRVIFTGKEANWLPPSYTSTNEKYLEQKSKRKAFSDMIEAFIGAFLIVTDYGTTIQMMKSLGLPTVPRDEKGKKKTKRNENFSLRKKTIDRLGQLMKSPTILFDENVSKDEIERFYVDKNFQRVEQAFQYTFTNKALLISAMTHASYINNRLTFCYER
jgi:dsRNA-specific ribonuclease